MLDYIMKLLTYFYIQLSACIQFFPVDCTSPRSFFVRRLCTGLRAALSAILIGFIPFCFSAAIIVPFGPAIWIDS